MQQSPAFAEPKPAGKLVVKEVVLVMVAFVGVPSTTGLPASAGSGTGKASKAATAISLGSQR